MTVRDFRSAQRRARRAHSGRQLLARVGHVVVGILFALFGAALIWLPRTASHTHGFSYAAISSIVGFGAFIGLFGADMAWRHAVDAPASRSFFMRWLMQLSDRTTPGHILGAVAALALLSLAIGVAIGRENEVEFGRTVLIAWLAFHLQVLGHEYGHFFAAQAVGYRPYRVVGGAFGFTAKEGRWKTHSNRVWRFLLGGAVFASVPPRGGRWSSAFWFAAAGPLASAVLLFACIRLDVILGHIAGLSEFIQLNVSIGIFLLIVNLAPVRLGASGAGTDGYQLLQLLKNR